MNESEMVTSAIHGDTTAFAGIVHAFQAPVFSICYRMLGDSQEAEDAAQETFIRAFTQLHRYDPERPFKTWLFSIASHYCIDRLRRRRMSWVSIDDEPIQFHPALWERRAGPEESALRHDRSREIQQLLAELPAQDRSAIVMHYWGDLSYEEIASATGTTVSAVKSRLHRARVKLSGMIEPKERPGAGSRTQPAMPPCCPRPTAMMAMAA